MKVLISIEVDYHPATAAIDNTHKVLDFIGNIYGVRDLSIYEDDISD